jgi:hypothetical protein
MSTYVILTRERTLDQEELDTYSREAKAASAGRDMKVLAFRALTKIWKEGRRKAPSY